jgi:hypothetical protein
MKKFIFLKIEDINASTRFLAFEVTFTSVARIQRFITTHPFDGSVL